MLDVMHLNVWVEPSLYGHCTCMYVFQKTVLAIQVIVQGLLCLSHLGSSMLFAQEASICM